MQRYVETNYHFCRLTGVCFEWILRKLSFPSIVQPICNELLKDIDQMAKKLYPADTIRQAQSILAAWKHIDPPVQFGPMTPEALQKEVETANALKSKILHLETELVDLRNQRDTVCLGIWDKVKRTRSGIKAIYGDDSTEYEIAGGTRSSERKPYRRKVMPEKPHSQPPPNPKVKIKIIIQTPSGLA